MGEQYGVIYADPPWNFRNYSKKGTGRNAISHYDCLSTEEICEIDVGAHAAKNCTLFLWATDPMLPMAFEVIKAWGFEYKTVGFCWVKTNKSADISALSETDFFTGLGYWTRANSELCLLATRGKPKRNDKGVRRLLVSPRREHSRKPEEIYNRIQRLVSGPYLEIFSRQTRVGWDCLGNQTGLFDKEVVDTRRQPSRLTPKQLRLDVDPHN